jgi:glycosyltransferase 2 family protein
VVVIVELLRLIPVTVQGIGVREAAFAALFALVGQDPASGFVISAVCFVLLNVATLVVGLAGYALAFNNRRIAQTAMGDG